MAPKKKISFLWILFLIAYNTAFGDVTISIGDVAVNGYTEDIVIPVTVANPDQSVGGFQFDVIAIPSLVTLSGVSPVDMENFSADFNILDDGSILVSAKMKCDDFNSKHNNLIPNGTYETIAGYIISKLGRIPNAGENLFMDIGQVIIKKASDRYINQVQIYPKSNSN